MLSALKNLLTPDPAKTGRGRKTDAVATASAPALLSAEEIDSAFYGYILGVQSPINAALNRFEQQVLKALKRLLKSEMDQNDLVPRLPAVIPSIMGTLRDPSSSTADLAARVGRDAVLVSEVIRLANSPYYRTGQQIRSLERALFALGRVGIRQLVINAAFKPLLNLNSGHFTRLSGTLLWDQSEKSAMACDCLARRLNQDRFHAYLMAIVQNVGFIVALQVLDRHFDGSEAPRSTVFQSGLIRLARRLSAQIARQWQFPEEVLAGLDSIADRNSQDELGSILTTGDRFAKLFFLSEQGHFSDDIGQLVERMPDELNGACQSCYRSIL